VLAVGFLGVLVTVAVVVAALGGVVADQRRVESAADLAALAAAGALQAGEDPCAAARTSAGRNGAGLAGCAVAGEVVTVRVERRTGSVLGRRFRLTGHARAGPVPP
jgi:secretion/DNA translocation related TadE-like protein